GTVHAHTNPVWIYFNRKASFQPEAAKELRNRIREFENTRISESVKDVAKEAESKLDNPPPQPPAITRYPVSPSNTTLFPAVLQRPKGLPPANIEGTVVNQSGQPLAGVLVSVRSTGTPVTTDAAGRFVISKIDANLPLFLRLTKSGYVTTN